MVWCGEGMGWGGVEEKGDMIVGVSRGFWGETCKGMGVGGDDKNVREIERWGGLEDEKDKDKGEGGSGKWRRRRITTKLKGWNDGRQREEEEGR